MQAAYGSRQREAGSFLFKVVVIFALMGVGMTLATRIGPGVYQYFLLRELADRVVNDYAKLPIHEVKRRVEYEMHRSKLSSDDFSMIKTTQGYRVEVDFRIPLVFMLGEKEIAVEGHEEWILTYKVES